MVKKLSAVLFLFFFAPTASANNLPKLWENDHSPRIRTRVSVEESVNLETASVGIVRPNLKALESDSFLFEIEGITYTAKRHSFEKRGEENYSWYGYVGDSDFLSTFTVVNGKLASNVWLSVGGRVKNYTTEPSGGKTYLKLSDSSKDVVGDDTYKFTLAETRGKRRSVTPGSSSCDRGYTPFHTVDLLMVYDSSVTNCSGDEPAGWCINDAEVKVMLQGWVDMLNATLHNSGIDFAHFNLVGIEKISSRTSVGQLYEDLAWLYENAEPVALREQYKADIIHYVVGYTRTKVGGLSGGAYTVSIRGASWETFVHEIGHSLGGNHQPEAYPDSSVIGGDSFAHCVSGSFRTAVAYYLPGICDMADVVPIYSNPQVALNGSATGIENQRDNSKRARELISLVAAYKPGTPPKCVAITEVTK